MELLSTESQNLGLLWKYGALGYSLGANQELRNYYIKEISILLAKTIVLQAKVNSFSLKSIQIQAKQNW